MDFLYELVTLYHEDSFGLIWKPGRKETGDNARPDEFAKRRSETKTYGLEPFFRISERMACINIENWIQAKQHGVEDSSK